MKKALNNKFLPRLGNKYPHWTTWTNRMWVLKHGDFIKIDNVVYIVKQVLKSDNRNIEPRVILEEHYYETPDEEILEGIREGMREALGGEIEPLSSITF